MNDEELQKELATIINQKLAGKKFFCHIVMHKGFDQTKQGKVHNNIVMQITNVQPDNDSFDLVKNMLLNYKMFVDKSLSTIMGLLPPPQSPPSNKEYQ